MKHLQHQRDLFHNFTDFEKPFGRVWHEGLWQVLRIFNIEEGLVRAIKTLYEIANSAVLLNSQLGEFFETTVGVRQGCLLSLILFNLFLEKITQESLHDHLTSISIGGRPLCYVRFADDITSRGSNNGELQDLTNRLVERATAYGMEVSKEKNEDIDQQHEQHQCRYYYERPETRGGDQFQIPGSNLVQGWHMLSSNLIRITAAMATLNRSWRCNTISIVSKFMFCKFLVTSILLCGCEIWTFLTDWQNRIQAFDSKCQRKFLRIPYLKHKTNDWVRSKTSFLLGPQERLLATVKRRNFCMVRACHTPRQPLQFHSLGHLGGWASP